MSPSGVPLPSGRRVLSRLVTLLRADAPTVRQSMSALMASSMSGMIAGLTLGAMTGTLEALPGLIILVPVAIDMRGNIFGALGSRLGTAIHTGQFDPRRRGGLVSQNLAAAGVLTFSASAALAVVAYLVASVLGIETISVVDMVVVSVLGGVLSSIVVLGITMGIAIVSVRRDWDMDNVSAPLVTVAGDVVTLPALYAATLVLAWPAVTVPIAAVAGTAAAVSLLWAATRKAMPVMRRILAESTPLLLAAGVLGVLAGIALDRRVEGMFVMPALLVMVPPFLQAAGALGGILAARLGSKLHLGTIRSRAVPEAAAAEDILLIYLYAAPVFLMVGAATVVVSVLAGFAHPGLATMLSLSLLAGGMAVTSAVVVAYLGAVVTFRFGLDPDNHGIPIVTSAIDLTGTLSLVTIMLTLGVV